jgi:protein-disulfide isomerase-like protein with CxxC motif
LAGGCHCFSDSYCRNSFVLEQRMNRKDIIRMAQETGVTAERVRDLVNFAALVASAEREACADIAENWNSNGFPRTGVAEQIRARGQA